MSSSTNNLFSKLDQSSDKAVLSYIEPAPRKKKKPNQKKSSALKAKGFTEQIADECLSEIVRKRGNTWVLYDDKTGVELGSYKDRKTAWQKQRIVRSQKKRVRLTKSKKKNGLAKRKPSSLASLKNMLKRFSKKESFSRTVAESLIFERFNSFVFEQSPTSALNAWEEFLAGLSQQTLMSDPKLKALLDAVHKSRLKVLDAASKLVVKNIEKSGDFTVSKPVLDKSDKEEPFYKLVVSMNDSKRKAPIQIKIEKNKPVMALPEVTLAALNQPGNDAKVLRAALMHLQAVELPHILDLEKSAQKRDKYLKTLEKNTDKIVNAMLPIQVAALKNLLSRKYGSIK